MKDNENKTQLYWAIGIIATAVLTGAAVTVLGHGSQKNSKEKPLEALLRSESNSSMKNLTSVIGNYAPIVSNNVTYDGVQNFDNDTDTTLLARMIFSEARSESYEVMKLVGEVVKNRAEKPNRFGEGIKGVILKPAQFSGFNLGDVNRVKLMDPLAYESRAVWDECYNAANEVLSSETNSTSADHFYMKGKPSWADEMTVEKTLALSTGYDLVLLKE